MVEDERRSERLVEVGGSRAGGGEHPQPEAPGMDAGAAGPQLVAGERDIALAFANIAMRIAAIGVGHGAVAEKLFPVRRGDVYAAIDLLRDAHSAEAKVLDDLVRLADRLPI